MAKRQAKFTPQDVATDGRLVDHSPDLWDDELGAVPRGLLTSAVRCFASNGFHATTTRDICVGMGLSPAALYVHFPSKELVLFEIIRTGHERVLAYIQDPAIPIAETAVERLRTIIWRYTAWHARHHVVARVCQYELAGLTPEHYDRIIELRHQTNEFFRAAVAAGVADGSFAEVAVKRVTRAIFSLCIDLVRWYRLSGPDSPEQLGDFYADLGLKMVAHNTSTPRGGAAHRTASPPRRRGTRPPAHAIVAPGE